MALIDHITYHPDEIRISPKLRKLFEQHEKYLREHPQTRTHTVDHGKAIPFYGNLFAYLNDAKISHELHWVILLLSDIDSPSEFDRSVKTLLIPNNHEVESIIAMASV